MTSLLVIHWSLQFNKFHKKNKIHILWFQHKENSSNNSKNIDKEIFQFSKTFALY